MPINRGYERSLAYASAFSLLGLMLAVPTASEAENLPGPSAEKGQELAEKFCSGCHIIRAEQEGTAPVGPPSFASIANKPGQTAEQIKGALEAPHPPMPDMHLTNNEMQDIIAYLETLRTNKTAPPLMPPSEQAKPELPDAT